jgi:hypothetical protein
MNVTKRFPSVSANYGHFGCKLMLQAYPQATAIQAQPKSSQVSTAWSMMSVIVSANCFILFHNLDFNLSPGTHLVFSSAEVE